MPDEQVWKVSELTREIRELLEGRIGSVWVEGEISNLRRQASGHQYFTLKDESSQLSCVMFRGVAQRASVRLEDGAAVRLFGDVSVYEPRGQYQMVVRRMKAQGQGTLQARFEALKQRLQQEGLFAEHEKQALPPFPRTVALVTSPTGAAVRDMLNVLQRRAPWIRVLIDPVRVQGAGAEQEIAAAIERLNDWRQNGLPPVDVIIAGRGGGSLEDLWNFNEECVARAIFESGIPVISAVGHEIDFTIADFVADLRAPTPSAAAELVSPSRDELLERLDGLEGAMQLHSDRRLAQLDQVLELMAKGPLQHEPGRRLMELEQRVDETEGELREQSRAVLEEARERLARHGEAVARMHPVTRLEAIAQALEHRSQALQNSLRHLTERYEQDLQSRADRLRVLGPQSVLSRGFSYTMTEGGELLRDASSVKSGQRLRTQLEKGSVLSVIEETQEEA